VDISRKKLVAPYVNDMATFEGSDKKYSQLSEEEKIDKLNILYEEGFKAGKAQFFELHPDIKTKTTETEEQKEAKKEREAQNKELRQAQKETSNSEW